MAEKKDTNPKVTTIEVQDEQIDIRVNAGGTFYAKFRETDYRSETLTNLVERLQRLGKKAAVRVAIPVTRIVQQKYGRGEVYEAGTLTGLHATNGKVLYKGAVSGSEQLDSYNFGRFSDTKIFEPLTPEQVEEHKALRKAAEEAKERLSVFEMDHTIDPQKAVKEAIEALVGKEVADAR